MDDISGILKRWEYIPDDVTVRLIEGQDRTLKVQMRLDLGLLQMEYTGRPDGKRPHGYESLLEYYQQQLKDHIKKFGSDESFFLDPDDCAALRNEALQYYYRYLSLFHLKVYEAVQRDTDRNIKVFDLIKKYAAEESDRFSLEQYRPYVLMMNARAAANVQLQQNRIDEALRTIEEAKYRIRFFFQQLGHPELTDQCREMTFLKEFAEEIQKRWNADPVVDLKEKMKKAVAAEDYETAARLRDEIKKMMNA